MTHTEISMRAELRALEYNVGRMSAQEVLDTWTFHFGRYDDFFVSTINYQASIYENITRPYKHNPYDWQCLCVDCLE